MARDIAATLPHGCGVVVVVLDRAETTGAPTKILKHTQRFWWQDGGQWSAAGNPIGVSSLASGIV
jgi:hypothetical protein